MDDAHHMIFECVSMDSIRWNHPSLFTNGPRSRSLYVIMVPNPAEVAAFVYECKKACYVFSVTLRMQIPQQLEIHFARI